MEEPRSRTRDPASFRDPSGFVWDEGGVLYRHVTRDHADDYDHLIDSGLYRALVADRSLVPHEEVDPATSPVADAHRVLRPEVVPFVSYPYEWCFSQLRDAALLTLDLQERSLDHGMTLLDASAYNVQFRDGAPVFIDTLSFVRRASDEPWSGYGQFCRHFLVPLALMSHRDPSLAQLARIHIDGVPVDLGSRLLPRRTKLRPGLGLHIAAHGAAVRRASGRRGPSRAFSERALRGLIASLRRAVSGLKAPRGGRWSGYYEDVDHYPEAALADKARIVGEMCRAVKPGTVWDLGANTGRFSSIAAEHATLVVAIDADHASVEEAYVSGRARGDRRVLPLVGDLTNPSPPLGWAGAERASLADRGPADLVMALALIHHLAIGNNVPLEMVADHLADLGRAAIVEFVPKSDPMVGRLLTGRRDVFASYTEDGFRHAFERRFGIARAESIAGTSRTLFLMRQR